MGIDLVVPPIAMFGAIIGVASVALFIWALISIIGTEFSNSTNKIVWIVVVVFFQFVGPLLWLLWGQKNEASQSKPPQQPYRY